MINKVFFNYFFQVLLIYKSWLRLMFLINAKQEKLFLNHIEILRQNQILFLKRTVILYKIQ